MAGMKDEQAPVQIKNPRPGFQGSKKGRSLLSGPVIKQRIFMRQQEPAFIQRHELLLKPVEAEIGRRPPGRLPEEPPRGDQSRQFKCCWPGIDLRLSDVLQFVLHDKEEIAHFIRCKDPAIAGPQQEEHAFGVHLRGAGPVEDLEIGTVVAGYSRFSGDPKETRPFIPLETLDAVGWKPVVGGKTLDLIIRLCRKKKTGTEQPER